MDLRQWILPVAPLLTGPIRTPPPPLQTSQGELNNNLSDPAGRRCLTMEHLRRKRQLSEK